MDDSVDGFQCIRGVQLQGTGYDNASFVLKRCGVVRHDDYFVIGCGDAAVRVVVNYMLVVVGDSRPCAILY